MMQYLENHSGHRLRLRQRIQEHGLDRLEPHEIIEYLLSYAIPRQDTNSLAHALIDHFGSVSNVLSADMDALGRVNGVGRRTALWLATIGETVRSFRRLEAEDRPCIRRPLDLFRYACSLRQEVQPPCTLQLCLDADGYLVLQRHLTPSRAWGEAEYMRCALGDMLGSNAVQAVILQYPSLRHDNMENYDIQHAQSYAETLSAVGCMLLDVVLIGEMEIISLKERGLIPEGSVSRRIASLHENYRETLSECIALPMDAFRETEERENGGII